MGVTEHEDTDDPDGGGYCSSHDRTDIDEGDFDTLATDSGQWRKFLCREAGVIPAVPRCAWLADVPDGPGSVLTRASGDAGYSCPGGVGAAS